MEEFEEVSLIPKGVGSLSTLLLSIGTIASLSLGFASVFLILMTSHWTVAPILNDGSKVALQANYDTIVTQIQRLQETTLNSTIPAGRFGHKITYFDGNNWTITSSGYLESHNLVDNGGIGKFEDFQLSMVTKSSTAGEVRSLCQDTTGNIGIGKFDGNGTKCLPRYKLDVK